jgi:hypothetical protein
MAAEPPEPRVRTRSLAACLLLIMLATGCTAVVGGKARSAPKLTPWPLAGQTVKGALLDDAALSTILNQSFKTDPHFPPRFGGPETLQDDGSRVPTDCLGVAAMLQQSVYQSANVKDVAVESWSHAGMSVKVISVKESVVALPTAADASAAFAKFSAQWQKCDGTGVPLPGGVLMLTPTITDVRVADSVVAATLSMEFTLPGSHPAVIPEARAIGVRGNCLIEVDVVFFRSSNPSSQRSRGLGDIHTSAIDIAHAMMDKVSALS